MHELSIAMNILNIAAAEAERRGGVRVVAIHLKLGPLSGVVKEALLSAYDLAGEISPMPDARLVIDEVPVVIYCETCEAEQPIASIQEFCCPKCGTFTANIISGRELDVVSMEIQE
jgi:hydrogenase nickel incorporation protein HypA/HybF